MDKDMQYHLAQQIQQHRLARGWTRSHLAATAGMSVHTLKHFERTGQIALGRFISLCRVLDVLPDLMRVFKPRARVSLDDWSVTESPIRRRGRSLAG